MKIIQVVCNLTIGVAFAIVAIVQIPQSTAQPSQPIAKAGKNCPSGYYKSGKYCVPYKDTKPAMERVEKDCPKGYYRSGKYCKLL